MPYTDRFIATDDLINHLKTIIATISDSAIKANYAGFLSVSAVTVYELSIKDIFSEFAAKKNKVFGKFVENHFDRINGRIKIDDLRGEHIKIFGNKYLSRFDKSLDLMERNIFHSSSTSLKALYGNLIQCRHSFVHKGDPTLTVNEVIDSYTYGKNVIHCLYSIMKR